MASFEAALDYVDVDGSCGAPNVADLTYFIGYLFMGGANLRTGCE